MGAWIAVAVGGALGSVARHGVNHLVQTRWLTAKFPISTAAVNLIGCLLIGLLAGLIAGNRLVVGLYWREFVFVGLLGGFTTFSTFGLDTVTLARTQSLGPALGNVIAHVGLGLVAVWIGMRITIST